MIDSNTDSFIFRPTISNRNPSFELKTALQSMRTLSTPISYWVDWGDGQVEYQTGSARHTYSFNDEYIHPIIKINGSFPVLNFAGETGLEIVQWGSIPFEYLSYGFSNCQNLKFSARDQPNLTRVRSLKALFNNCSDFNEPLNNWNVSNVKNMTNMFRKATVFNQPLTRWNVSSVTAMVGMFYEASNFNQPLTSWNVSSVTTMVGMFYQASSFNQPLPNWNVTKVTDMTAMFSYANNFNQSLDEWDVSSVTNMTAMFRKATAFNHPLARWNVSNVTNMTAMFYEALNFNQPLASWNVSNVTIMYEMFYNARQFNQSLDSWDVSKVISMDCMFWGTNMVAFPDWYPTDMICEDEEDDEEDELDPNRHKQLVALHPQLIRQAQTQETIPSSRLDLQRVSDDLQRVYGPETAQLVSLFLNPNDTIADVLRVLNDIKSVLFETQEDANLERYLDNLFKKKTVKPSGMRPCRNERSFIDQDTIIYLLADQDIVYDSDNFCYTREDFKQIQKNANRFRNPTDKRFTELRWSDWSGNDITPRTVY